MEIPNQPSAAPGSQRDLIVNSWTHQELVTQVLEHLNKSPYNAHILYTPVYQQRFAEIRNQNGPLYFGTLLQGVSISLRERTGAWDKQIATLSMAMAELELVPLSSIEPEEIDWLWFPYIPRKKLTLMEGDPAGGKTYLLLAIASAITNGFALPDQEGHVDSPHNPPGTVLYITAEDGLADTIRPRADKVGADLDRLWVPPRPEAFSLADPQALSNAMAHYRPQMVVLDPIQAFLGAEMDMHRTNEVRPFMTTLLGLGIEHNCAMVAVRHWTKESGRRARYRGQGSADFAAAARSVLSVGDSPEDAKLKIMAQTKISLAQLGLSMVFSISDDGLEWCGTSTITADELSAAQPKKHHHQRKDAMEWLRDYLKDGPQPSALIAHAAQAVGIPERTLRRAKEHLHVLATKDGTVWFWRLPSFNKQWDRERYPGQEEE